MMTKWMMEIREASDIENPSWPEDVTNIGENQSPVERANQIVNKWNRERPLNMRVLTRVFKIEETTVWKKKL